MKTAKEILDEQFCGLLFSDEEAIIQCMELYAAQFKNKPNMTFPINTVGYWLSKIGDPEIRRKTADRIISAHYPEYLFQIVNGVESTYDAICYAFDWDKTTEGQNYWLAVAQVYLKHSA